MFVDKKSVGQMSVDQMSVVQNVIQPNAIGQMSSGKIFVLNISFDLMCLSQMSLAQC
jgi:hypothetical protein